MGCLRGSVHFPLPGAYLDMLGPGKVTKEDPPITILRYLNGLSSVLAGFYFFINFVTFSECAEERTRRGGDYS